MLACDGPITRTAFSGEIATVEDAIPTEKLDGTPPPHASGTAGLR